MYRYIPERNPVEDTFLYHQIAESIRRDILNGRYKPGDRLPAVRQLCEHWNCTPGTIQRAYNELAREGLVVSRAGRGTQVAGVVPQARMQGQETIRRANLVNRLESALLEALTAGYDLNEIQQAMDLAMDRWRAVSPVQAVSDTGVVRFAGSHDMVVNELAHSIFGQALPTVNLLLTYSGSLGGLIALAEGKADVAGCHLWDVESDSYNIPFVHRLLPGKDVTVVTLAHRRQGLIVAPGNPLNIHALKDLANPGVRFVNRQSGSGTRVWLDAMLAKQGIDAREIDGYGDERMTHSDVARTVAEGGADAGLGLEHAGHAFGLDFVFLNRERYDLVMKAAAGVQSPLRDLVDWLASDAGRQFVEKHTGYECQETGRIQY
jgi:molybdate-binding protein/DNA-binding transcriptional regulator YhcF (GntR family)